MKNRILSGSAKFFARIYLGLLSLSVLFPLFWTVSTSMKTNQQFFEDPWSLPTSFNIENYIRIWKDIELSRNFLNSVVISGVVVVACLLLGAMTAYCCTRLGLRAGKYVTAIYLSGMFVPSIICAVSIFLQMRDLNLLESRLGLILLYIALQMPFSVYVLSGFFRTLPHELEEAAALDGSGLMRTFWTIMLPLAKPGLATVSIFNFLTAWNEYTMASIIMLDPKKTTLPVVLVELQGSLRNQADWVGLFAGMVIVIIPLMIIYFVFQKYITSGVTAGAIKG